MEKFISNTAIINPIIGGILIGLASIGLMLFNGRIAGISGILNGAIHFRKGDMLWRVTFITGMILAGAVIYYFNEDYALIEIRRSMWAYCIAGLVNMGQTGVHVGPCGSKWHQNGLKWVQKRLKWVKSGPKRPL